ncbi:major capsid protein [Pseudomonas citronellolis]|uniref:major capsid protein n=1 Tax=Pseudomonas citronellolis TaxID=53408 RepID=UPI0023E391A3|nr:major capsid protein [Pseudomonas citronellolis]MDF3932223.1 major capsid protein [Pseudomonas citronellolis]
MNHNTHRRIGQAVAGTAALGSTLLATAYAAVPAEATGALATAGEDTNTVGWAVFAVLVAAAAFKYIRRAL